MRRWAGRLWRLTWTAALTATLTACVMLCLAFAALWAASYFRHLSASFDRPLPNPDAEPPALAEAPTPLLPEYRDAYRTSGSPWAGEEVIPVDETIGAWAFDGQAGVRWSHAVRPSMRESSRSGWTRPSGYATRPPKWTFEIEDHGLFTPSTAFLARPAFEFVRRDARHVIFGADSVSAAAPLWAPTLLLAMPPLLVVTTVLRRRRRRRRLDRVGTCRRCGYDLRASPGRCPECGEVAAPSGEPRHDVP